MIHESASEITAIVAGSAGLVLATLLPLMRWARADHLTPRWLRQLPLTCAVLLLLILAAPSKGATS
ncbi:hypothetical protein [Streptomyces sp. NPDC127038]|uniref:hypothetical protein n=1 Tax=Streptomyces sp. NPDC127038 TaxID=3347114 RepID=UPI003649B26E